MKKSKSSPLSVLLHWKLLNAVKLEMGLETFVNFLCDGRRNFVCMKNQDEKLLPSMGRDKWCREKKKIPNLNAEHCLEQDWGTVALFFPARNRRLVT